MSPASARSAEGHPGVACSDSINPAVYRAWPRAAAAADENYGYFGSWWTWASSICQPWEGPVAQAHLGPGCPRATDGLFADLRSGHLTVATGLSQGLDTDL